ncbi:uncharacterized protein PD653_3980 [Nocardioides sp. PD653]|nr:uncharacterized protein PD653B2_2044 [Nocardioides sp. PD653-B2]GAW56543.1 uncharacterized protein PD653_3980 [Nocardioides sp. PD653]
MGRVVRLVVAGAMIVLATLLTVRNGVRRRFVFPEHFLSLLGSLLTGLGVALGITALQRRR